MKYAVIATNDSHGYDFFAPLTALMWDRVGGMKTLCFLTDDMKDWMAPAASVVLRGLEHVGVSPYWIGQIEGYRTGQVAQSVRQHAAALDLPETDELTTGDIDMWPFQKPWFHQHDPSKHDVTLYYSNAYGEKYPPFHPTPYVSATVKIWRQFMGLENRGEVRTQLQANFDRTLGRYHDSWTAWWHDELYYNSKLRAWGGYPGRCQMIPRAGQPPHDRIDRGCWPEKIDWSKPLVDTHLVRPGAMPENWRRIRPILEHFVPDQLTWADNYMQEYRRARYGG